MDPFVKFGILALVVTKLVDTIRNAVDAGATLPKATWNLAAFAVGLVLAFAFHVNVLANLGGGSITVGVGEAVSGIGLGAGGSGWHELLDALSSYAASKAPPAA